MRPEANSPALRRARGPRGGRGRADPAPCGRVAAHGARHSAHRVGLGRLRAADPAGGVSAHQGAENKWRDGIFTVVIDLKAVGALLIIESLRS